MKQNANETAHLCGLTTYSGGVCITSGSVFLVSRQGKADFRDRQRRYFRENGFVERLCRRRPVADALAEQILMRRFRFRGQGQHRLAAARIRQRRLGSHPCQARTGERERQRR